jgi:hypothetical protein
MEVNKEKVCCESKKSCCSPKKETKSKDECKKECCLKADNILTLENCFIDNNKVESTVIVKKSIILPIALFTTVDLDKEDWKRNDYRFKPKILGKQILCYKQSWLI